MKPQEMLKINYESGTAEFTTTDEFDELDPLLKADILRDILEDVKIAYNESLDDFENETF